MEMLTNSKGERIINFASLEKENFTGEVFKGIYLESIEREGTKANGGKFKTVDHKFEVDGSIVLVNNTGLLNWFLTKGKFNNGTIGVEPGETVTMSYRGRDDKGHKVQLAK